MLNKNSQENCDVCFKIKCRGCGWEPTEEEVAKIQAGELRTCPLCGWQPGEK